MLFSPYTVDLHPFLPDDWREELGSAAAECRRVFKPESGPGSLGWGPAAGLDYRTATYPAVEKRLPWLAHLHQAVLPALLALRLGREVKPIVAPHGLTLNLLEITSTRPGLEWHLDGNDVALVVILANSRWTEGTGGRLLTHDGVQVRHHELVPSWGLVVPTGVLPHAVEPMNEQLATGGRLTAMLAFTTGQQDRAAGLSDYLFSPE